MIDLTLSDDLVQVRAAARDFAHRTIRPAVEAAERQTDGHLDRDSYLAVFKAGTSMGLHSMLLPLEYGGAGQGAIANAIVQEELGAVDVGVGSSLNLTAAVAQLIVVGGTEEQRQRWLPAICSSDDHVLAGALNEAGVAGSELFCPMPDPNLGLRTRATRDGDSYVIDGAKAGWVTNAGVAKAYFVFARTSTDGPTMATTTAFYVPADTPGLSVGARSHLLGMRSSWHAELNFDDLRVPLDHRLGDEGHGLELMGMATGAMVVGLAAGFVGVARAAYEQALAYASERRSWGQPIREHQAVALKLADMAVDLQAARLMVWDAAAAVDRMDIAALPVKLPAAKTFAVDVATSNAEKAVQVLGAMGVARGVGPEKLLRDAWTGYACDFTRDMLRLGIAQVLEAPSG